MTEQDQQKKTRVCVTTNIMLAGLLLFQERYESREGSCIMQPQVSIMIPSCEFTVVVRWGEKFEPGSIISRKACNSITTETVCVGCVFSRHGVHFVGLGTFLGTGTVCFSAFVDLSHPFGFSTCKGLCIGVKIGCKSYDESYAPYMAIFHNTSNCKPDPPNLSI